MNRPTYNMMNATEQYMHRRRRERLAAMLDYRKVYGTPAPKDIATRPYDNQIVEEKSRVEIDKFVDFTNVDILTGAKKCK